MDLLSVHEALGTGEVNRQFSASDWPTQGILLDTGRGVFVNFRNKCRIDVFDLIAVVIDDITTEADQQKVLVRYVKDSPVDHHDGERLEGLRP